MRFSLLITHYSLLNSMSDNVIRVENLGKKYQIRHQNNPSAYTLRDKLTRGVKSLTKSRVQSPTEEFWALDNLSFEVKRGDRLGIIGHNGAGKSTLLKILSRITEPTTGRITLKGRVASLLEVGTGFHPELTGRENIYLNGAILGMGKGEIRRKFEEIVAFAEVEKFLDTPVKRYSSGMYVRLAFAVAAHLEPEILIVDEVLAVGDARFQQKCLGKMGDISQQEGRTVLFVSHAMASVQRLCTRALWLDKGHLKEDGEVSQVAQQYLAHTTTSSEAQDNLLEYPRSSNHQSDLRFRQCLLLNGEGKPNSTLGLGEPFSVYLEAISQESYQQISVMVGINAVDQTRITTAVSGEVGQLFSVSPNAPLKLTLSFEKLMLVPGNYSLSIALRHEKIFLDKLNYIAKFQVSTVTYGDTPHYNRAVWGLIKTPVRWKVADYLAMPKK